MRRSRDAPKRRAVKEDRRTRWRNKRLTEGRCVSCSKPRNAHGESPYRDMCVKCAVTKRVTRQQRQNYQPWKPGGRGRPPLVRIKVKPPAPTV